VRGGRRGPVRTEALSAEAPERQLYGEQEHPRATLRENLQNEKLEDCENPDAKIVQETFAGKNRVAGTRSCGRH